MMAAHNAGTGLDRFQSGLLAALESRGVDLRGDIPLPIHVDVARTLDTTSSRVQNGVAHLRRHLGITGTRHQFNPNNQRIAEAVTAERVARAPRPAARASASAVPVASSDPFEDAHEGPMTAHLNGTAAPEAAESASARLLEALADLNLDPAESVPVETQILLAARLGLTQQGLKQAHEQLRAEMATATAKPLLGGPKRLLKGTASGIPAQIDKPAPVRSQPATPAPDAAAVVDSYPDLFPEADGDELQPRVYAEIRRRGIDLRRAVAMEHLQAIGYAVGEDAMCVRGVIGRLRTKLGIRAKSPGRTARMRETVATPAAPQLTEDKPARVLALEIAAALAQVQGDERPAALVQAGRLLERLLG